MRGTANRSQSDMYASFILTIERAPARHLSLRSRDAPRTLDACDVVRQRLVGVAEGIAQLRVERTGIRGRAQGTHVLLQHLPPLRTAAEHQVHPGPRLAVLWLLHLLDLL